MNHFSQNIERHVLGAAMLETYSADLLVGKAKESDFYFEENQKIFSAIARARQEQKTPDIVFLSNQVQKELLFEISCEVVSAANIDDHLKELIEFSQRRALVKVLGEQLQCVQESEAPITELQSSVESKITAVGENRNQDNEPRQLRESLRKAALNWSDIVSGKKKGIMSGLSAIDHVLQGFQPGKLLVVAARPGVGKSALILQIARQCGAPVLIQSLEMLEEENAERLISQVCEGVDSYTLRSAEGLNRNKAKLSLAVTELSNLPIFISDDPGKTSRQMRSDAQRLKRKHDLKIMFVDYLQLMESDERRGNRSIEVGMTSKSLKQIANTLGITVVAVSSLSRKCEDREDKRPIKSDLRESGDIEHDADGILMLYRESDYSKTAMENDRIKPITEFLWRKNRGGMTGVELARYSGPRLRFDDMTTGDGSMYRNFLSGKESGVW